MSEPPADLQPYRPSPFVFATPKDLFARIDRRAVAWYCRKDLPALPVPDPPAGIQNFNPPECRQRTIEVWQATIHLLQALDAWQDWFRKLRAEGDVHPASALWCQETALQSVRVLCTHRVNMPPFDRESEAAILAMLPPIPDWSMAGTDDRWDPEQNQFVLYQRPRWQDDPQFLGRYYGGPEKRWETSTRLRGAALQLRLLLERFPMTALGSDSAAATSPAWQQQKERLDQLHQLAVRCINGVLRLQTLSSRP